MASVPSGVVGPAVDGLRRVDGPSDDLVDGLSVAGPPPLVEFVPGVALVDGLSVGGPERPWLLPVVRFVERRSALLLVGGGLGEMLFAAGAEDFESLAEDDDDDEREDEDFLGGAFLDPADDDAEDCAPNFASSGDCALEASTNPIKLSAFSGEREEDEALLFESSSSCRRRRSTSRRSSSSEDSGAPPPPAPPPALADEELELELEELEEAAPSGTRPMILSASSLLPKYMAGSDRVSTMALEATLHVSDAAMVVMGMEPWDRGEVQNQLLMQKMMLVRR